MQLDPDSPFATQIERLDGKEFEKVVAAAFLYQGYSVFRNLSIAIEKQQVAEIDVFATLITPLHELRLAIECKGQTPNFGDIRKFSTVRQILKSSQLELIAYGSNDIRQAHLHFARSLGIHLYKKEDLNKMLLPILWGDEIRRDRIQSLNRSLCVFDIQDFLFEIADKEPTITIRKQFAKYKRYLSQELWAIDKPLDQLKDSFDRAENEYNDFTERIAVQLGTRASSQLTNPTVPVVQTAMFLELLHRIFNLYAIMRCSIDAKMSQGRTFLTDSIQSPILKEALNKLCDNSSTISKFFNFIYNWLFLWGGFIIKQGAMEEHDYELIAKESNISAETARLFLKLLQHVYSGGENLFYEGDDKLFMKYVPAAFRALGKIHRKSISSEYNSISVFYEDDKNENLLNAALTSIGGLTGLKFN